MKYILSKHNEKRLIGWYVSDVTVGMLHVSKDRKRAKDFDEEITKEIAQSCHDTFGAEFKKEEEKSNG